MPRIKTSLAVSAIVLFSFLLLSSAAAVAQSQQSKDEYCDRYANDDADRHQQGDTVQGATRGAAGGAIVGAITGDLIEGAAIGAGIGALGGAIRREESRQNLYRQAYDDCMRRNE